MYIEKVIDNIKKRPKMYVTEVKIEYIYHYISGYCLASNHFSADDIDKWFCGWFWKWLVKWIEDNIEPEYQPKSVIWYDDIKVIAEKEENVFCKHFLDKVAKYFWTLLHVQIGQSCNAPVGYVANQPQAIADII